MKLNNDYFPTLLSLISKEFPSLQEKQIRHIANKVTNYLRRCHQDCYGLEVSSKPFDRSPSKHYYSFLQINSQHARVFVRVTVD